MLVPLLSSALAADVDIALRGVCDGSTAVRTDTDRLLVAYDEDRALHAYRIDGGDSLGTHDLSAALDLPGERELDLEASVRVKDTVWWLGSHGLNRDGDERPSRRVLFSTNLPTTDDLSDLALTRPAVDLTRALTKAKDLSLTDEVLARPPKEGGLNLEGLDVHPDGGFLVGFRSPLTSDDGMSGEATVVRLAAKVKKDTIVYKVAETHRLDLDDRGVRSLVADGDGWRILAGPVPTGGTFAIYRWDGRSSTVERLEADLTGLNPEALVPLADGRWLVLSDDGAIRRIDAGSTDDDGLSECKDIRLNNAQGATHPSVYARGRILDLE